MNFKHKWTTRDVLVRRIVQTWARGDFLRLAADPSGPRFIAFQVSGPTPKQLAEDFVAARNWAASVVMQMECTVITKTVRSPAHGTHAFPASIEVTPAQAMRIAMAAEDSIERFLGALWQFDEKAPQLRHWALSNPLKIIELGNSIPGLLAAVQWMLDNPRPGIFQRQIVAPGVHTKLIELHRGTLATMLDLALPQEAVSEEFSGVGAFNSRFGFKEAPSQIRFRSLDPAIAVIPGHPAADLSLDADTFAQLAPASVSHVVICENLISYLCLPQLPGCLAIFGGGYAARTLAKPDWMQGMAVIYWGDIDTHGLAILGKLREVLPQTRSILMDIATAMACRTLWGVDGHGVSSEPSNLTDAEAVLYRALTSPGELQGVRVEQEHIGMDVVTEALERAVGFCPRNHGRLGKG